MQIYSERANFSHYSKGYTIMILDDFLADLRIRVMKNCFAFSKTYGDYAERKRIVKMPYPIYRIIISNRKRKDMDSIYHWYANSKKECLRFKPNKYKYSKLHTKHMKRIYTLILIGKGDTDRYNDGRRADMDIDYNGSFFLVSKGLSTRIKPDDLIYNCNRKMKYLTKRRFLYSSYKNFMDLDTYYRDRIMSVIRHDYYNTLRDYHRLI